jgi:hypothetical protein
MRVRQPAVVPITPGMPFHFVAPSRPSSAQVCAEFYRLARAEGIHCALDYRVVNPKYGRFCRFDVVILSDDKSTILAIVACKRTSRAALGMTKQRRRYETFGVPVIWVRGWPAIKIGIRQAIGIVRPDDPKADPYEFLRQFEDRS